MRIEQSDTMNAKNAHKNALIIQRVNILMSWHGKPAVIILTALTITQVQAYSQQ